MKALYKSDLIYLSDRKVPKKENLKGFSDPDRLSNERYNDWFESAQSYPCSEGEKEKFLKYLYDTYMKNPNTDHISMAKYLEQGIEIDSERIVLKRVTSFPGNPPKRIVEKQAFFVPAPGKPAKLPEMVDILKTKIVETYRKRGDNKTLITKGRSYTGNELADEIEDNTEQGIEMVYTLIRLTIDLLARDKINQNLPPGSSAVEGNEAVEYGQFILDNKFEAAVWRDIPVWWDRLKRKSKSYSNKELYTLFRNSKG